VIGRFTEDDAIDIEQHGNRGRIAMQTQQHVLGVEIVMANPRRRHLPDQRDRCVPGITAHCGIVGHEHGGQIGAWRHVAGHDVGAPQTHGGGIDRVCENRRRGDAELVQALRDSQLERRACRPAKEIAGQRGEGAAVTVMTDDDALTVGKGGDVCGASAGDRPSSGAGCGVVVQRSAAKQVLNFGRDSRVTHSVRGADDQRNEARRQLARIVGHEPTTR